MARCCERSAIAPIDEWARVLHSADPRANQQSTQPAYVKPETRHTTNMNTPHTGTLTHSLTRDSRRTTFGIARDPMTAPVPVKVVPQPRRAPYPVEMMMCCASPSKGVSRRAAFNTRDRPIPGQSWLLGFGLCAGPQSRSTSAKSAPEIICADFGGHTSADVGGQNRSRNWPMSDPNRSTSVQTWSASIDSGPSLADVC